MKKQSKSTIVMDGKYLEIRSLINDLKSKDGLVRQVAREKLVSIGPPAVSQLAQLIKRTSAVLRWEAVKALSQIADPESAPLFIAALSDKDEEIRWLAAEGLISIGARARMPLLRELANNPKSLFIRKGAHHFFGAMKELEQSIRYDELLAALDSHDAKLSSPIAAEKLLKSIDP